MITTDRLLYTFEYFYHMDMANAAIHMSEVKFSPITFKLAEMFPPITTNLEHVKSHVGKYETDTGR